MSFTCAELHTIQASDSIIWLSMLCVVFITYMYGLHSLDILYLLII